MDKHRASIKTKEIAMVDLTKLAHDGDTLELPDRRSLRLRIVPDEHTTINDFDSFGRIEWCERPVLTGHAARPDGFDGNAEKLWAEQNGGQFWWQPPADVPRTSEHFGALRRIVIDVVTYGYAVYMLELLEGTDAYGAPIVRDVASLWGIEPFADAEYVHTIVCDLAHELGIKVAE